MKFSSMWVFVWILTVVFAVSGWTDTIKLRSGDQIIGTILSENPEAFVIDVNGNQLTVRRADVEFVIQNGVRRDIGSPSAPSLPAIPGATQPAAAPGIPSVTPSQPMIPPVQPAAPQKPILPVVLPTGKTYQVTGGAIRFRQTPDPNSTIVATLQGKTLLFELETKEGWIHAKTLEGGEGWIHTNFVQPMGNTPYLVGAEELNVREGPGEVFRSLARLRRGDVVIQLEEQADWFNVLTEDSLAGWCNKSTLLPLPELTAWKPPMSVVNNQEAGMPILVQKAPTAPGQQKVLFTVRDEKIVLGDITKILIFYKDAALFNQPNLTYVSPDILQRRRLKSSVEILNLGLPEETGMNFIGGDILTVQGHPAAEGRQFTLTTPDAPTLAFGFVVQDGPSRGAMILVQ